jgi:hypothetical protein
MSECGRYNSFVSNEKKPVFHIEYPTQFPQISQQEMQNFCHGQDQTGFSTAIKNLTLDGWVEYCTGQVSNTTCIPPSGGGGRPPRPPWPPRPTTTGRPVPPTTSLRPFTTTIHTSTRTSTRTSAKPTSTPGGGNGCTVAHWGQCGGQNWNGCTVCAVSILINFVSINQIL